MVTKNNYLALLMCVVGILQSDSTIYYPTADEALRYLEGTGGFLGSGIYESIAQDGDNFYLESAMWNGGQPIKKRTLITEDEAKEFLENWQKNIKISQKQGRKLNNTERANPLRRVV